VKADYDILAVNKMYKRDIRIGSFSYSSRMLPEDANRNKRRRRWRALRRRSYSRERSCFVFAARNRVGNDYITGRGNPSILGERHMSPDYRSRGACCAREVTALARSRSSLVVGVRMRYLAAGTNL